jgi:hypothetical protein
MKRVQIKKMISLGIALTIFLTLQSGCSYGFEGISGDGNVAKQDRDISAFSALDVGGAFKVYLTQGEEEALVVEADENLLDVISTEVRGNTLVIKTTETIRNAEAMNIYLTFVKMDELEISGACHLSGENKMTFDDLEMDCSGASQIDLKLSADNLELEFSGASDIEMYGSAGSVSMDISGASKFDAYDLEVQKYSIDISGAAHAKIFVTEELSADVSGAASLKYRGDASLTDWDVSGAGSLKKD